MTNSNDTIGIRTCDLPTCSAVPQPTAPPRNPPPILPLYVRKCIRTYLNYCSNLSSANLQTQVCRVVETRLDFLNDYTVKVNKFLCVYKLINKIQRGVNSSPFLY
jgi:hypothetical protein